MQRRVIKHGPSTLIISLPSKWAKANNIVKGSELEVEEKGKALSISVKGEMETQPMEAELDVTGMERTMIMYAIRGLYRVGYDTIRLKFSSPETKYSRTGEILSVLSVIHTEVNRLVGYEVVEEKRTTCVIKDLQMVSDKDFDNVLRRIFLLTMDMVDVFVNGAKTCDISVLNTMEQKHDSITKFVSYCIRILNKKGHPLQLNIPYYFYILATIDRIADIVKYAARDLRKSKTGINGKGAEILDILNQSMQRYYEVFYKFDKLKFDEVNINRYKAENILKGLPHATKAQKLVVLASVYQIFEILIYLIEARIALEQQNQSIMTATP